MYDKGKLGSVVKIEQMLVNDESGEKYAKIVGNTFYMGQGNWVGPMGKSSHCAIFPALHLPLGMEVLC